MCLRVCVCVHLEAINNYSCKIKGTKVQSSLQLWYCSEVTSHSLATYTLATQMLDTLISITLEWYNMRELTHSKILAYNHVHKTKSKFKSLGTFTQDSLLKPYTMLCLPLRLSCTVRTYMQNRALVTLQLRVPCKQISTQNSIKRCCLLDKYSQTSATLPLSGTIHI